MECFDDITAEMRAFKNHPNAKKSVSGVFLAGLLNGLANRLDAARKREIATAENSLAVGNAAAMREALEVVLRFLQWMYAQEGESAVISRVRIADEIDRVISALSEPPRNCDVGTAEEQAERYHATGEVYHTLTLTNAFAWAQMPYEEGGATDGVQSAS